MTANKFELLARLGYAARGIVYAILGVLALLGAGAEATPEGALSSVLSQPFGRVMLGAIAIGLIGHVLWRFAQAFLNADHQDDDAKGIAVRVGNFASGVVNGALAIGAATMALGSGRTGSGGEQGAAASVMSMPFGNILIGLFGAALIVASLVQLWRGFSKKYQERITLPAGRENVLHPVCAVGLGARGVLLAVTGGFFIYAAITVDPEQAGGISQALDWLHSLPFGGALYAAAALGLIAFGLYSLIEARYRQLDAPSGHSLRRAAGKLPGVPG